MKTKNYIFLILMGFVSNSVYGINSLLDATPKKPVKKKIKQATDEIIFSEKEIEKLIRQATPLNNFNKPILEVDQKKDIISRPKKV